MNIPAITFSSEIKFSDDKQSAQVLREVDFGLQKVDVTLPAIFSCDLRLNTPRFANVKSILKAKPGLHTMDDIAVPGYIH